MLLSQEKRLTLLVYRFEDMLAIRCSGSAQAISRGLGAQRYILNEP